MYSSATFVMQLEAPYMLYGPPSVLYYSCSTHACSCFNYYITYNTIVKIDILYSYCHEVVAHACILMHVHVVQSILDADVLCHFGRGTFSSLQMGRVVLLPLQFPLTDGLQKLPITRNAWVFLQKSATFGFSLVPPR